MWRLYYDRAIDLDDERVREAERDRLVARSGSRGDGLVGRLRRRGALAAAWVAERLDDCAAREGLARSVGERGL